MLIIDEPPNLYIRFYGLDMKHNDTVLEILNYALKGVTLREDVFSTEFTQYLNGKAIGIEEFHQGIKSLRNNYISIQFKILSMASSEHSVHSHHLVTTVNIKNEVSRFEVFAIYEFHDGKAVRCFESLRELSDSDAVSVFF